MSAAGPSDIERSATPKAPSSAIDHQPIYVSDQDCNELEEGTDAGGMITSSCPGDDAPDSDGTRRTSRRPKTKFKPFIKPFIKHSFWPSWPFPVAVKDLFEVSVETFDQVLLRYIYKEKEWYYRLSMEPALGSKDDARLGLMVRCAPGQEVLVGRLFARGDVTAESPLFEVVVVGAMLSSGCDGEEAPRLVLRPVIYV